MGTSDVFCWSNMHRILLEERGREARINPLIHVYLVMIGLVLSLARYKMFSIDHAYIVCQGLIHYSFLFNDYSGLYQCKSRPWCFSVRAFHRPPVCVNVCPLFLIHLTSVLRFVFVSSTLDR